MNPTQAQVIANLVQAVERYLSGPTPMRRRLLNEALTEARRLPDPGCEYCGGVGHRLGHSENCRDDNCVMARGVGDCNGEAGPCDCSVMDTLLHT